MKNPTTLTTVLLLLSSHALANAADGTVVLPAIRVLANSDTITSSIPGANVMVNKAQIEAAVARSTEDVLKKVTGVYVKPEEESAIVANIGVRGLSSGDYKTLILEDGVPVAPGLFVGNARYYNPRVEHIDGIEVLKGSAALRYGPGNIGGVINYISKKPIDGVATDSAYGSWNTIKNTLELGGTSPNKDSYVGAVITAVTSDGFLNKGYEAKDVVLKAGTAIGSNQQVGVKISHYDSNANISYRGHFLDEYNKKADNNPAPDDYLLSKRNAVAINHQLQLNSNVRVNSLMYYSNFSRNYWRYKVDNAASTAQKKWVYTNNLDGSNRAFERLGAESRLTANTTLLGLSGVAEAGIRYMREAMDDITIGATRAAPRTGTIGKDVTDSAETFALYAQNTFDISDKLTVSPALRAETYRQKRLNNQTSIAATTSNTEVMPGLGFTYLVAPTAQVYGSVYNAFAPALNADALDGLVDQQLDAEKSTNLEMGVRGKVNALQYELTAFSMGFANQIIPANSNTQLQKTNGGKTQHHGLEAGVSSSLPHGFNVSTNATWIPAADFDGNRYKADGITLDVADGKRVPYTPKLIANVAVGYSMAGVKAELSANYTAKQYTDTANTTAISQNTTGFFTGQVGSNTVTNLSVAYQAAPKVEVYAAVKNLLGEHYIASLRQGIYVGPERSYTAGVRFKH